MMDENHQGSPCPEEDVARRYAAGTLGVDEATTFEAHYFACDRCWRDLRRALEIRAALADGVPEAAPAPRAGVVVTRWHRWAPLAAAAGVVILAGVGVGLWDLRTPEEAGPGLLRGEREVLDLTVELVGEQVRAEWPAVSGAEVYLVRVLDADGRQLLERETAGTGLHVERHALETPGGVFYFKVQALDSLRQVVESSRPIEVRIPPQTEEP